MKVIPNLPKHISSLVLTVNNNQYIIFMSTDKHICYLNTAPTNGDLDTILPYLLKNNMVWTSIPLHTPEFNTCVEKLIHYGFHHPYVCQQTPIGHPLPPSLALCRKKYSSKQYNIEMIRNKVQYVLKNQPLVRCNLSFRMPPETISFLKKLPHSGHTKNKNKTITQKEVTGTLYVSHIDKDTIHTIEVEPRSVNTGKEEEVQVERIKFNFHSHPKEAYERYKVQYAWPSLTDFLAILKMSKENIFHLVVTIEGLYLLCIAPYWSTRTQKIKRSFVKQKFHIPHSRKITPYQFAELINSIQYKGHPIFQVTFIPWNKVDKPFHLTYPKYDGQCFSIDDTQQLYTRLHNKIH